MEVQSMQRELLVLVVPAVVLAVLVLSSKVLRTVIRESILRPKQHCNIHVGGDRVTVVRHNESDAKEA
jgi:hypothetical protein